MTIPSVMFLEMAKDALTRRDRLVLGMEAKEFHCLGPKRMEEIRQSVEAFVAAGDIAPPTQYDVAEYTGMLAGYLLGIETARTLLAMTPKAVQADISL